MTNENEKFIEKGKDKQSIAEIIGNVFKESLQKSIETGEKPIWTKGFWKANVFNFTRPDYKYKAYNLILLDKFLSDKTPCVGTFKQWKALNVNDKSKEDKSKSIHIKKGAKGGLIVGFVPYYKVLESLKKENKDEYEMLVEFVEKNKYKQNHKELFEPFIKQGKMGMYMGLKGTTVFSMDDVDNLSNEFKDKMHSILTKNRKEKENLLSGNQTQMADKIVSSYAESQNIEITNVLTGGVGTAYYSSLENKIVCPLKEQYTNDGMYYKTLFHELGHSTQKETGRKKDDYAKEELVAEFTACSLMEMCGLKMNGLKDNSRTYLESWGKYIKSERSKEENKASEEKTDIDTVKELFNTVDDKALVFCLIEAEKAVNVIMDKYNEMEKEKTEKIENVKGEER